MDAYNAFMLTDGITTKSAAALSGYHQTHIRRLARLGLIVAEPFGRDWMVSKSSLIEYMKKMNEQGGKRGPKTET